MMDVIEASPLWTALSISSWVWAVEELCISQWVNQWATFFLGFCLWAPGLASLSDGLWPGSLRQLNSFPGSHHSSGKETRTPAKFLLSRPSATEAMCHVSSHQEDCQQMCASKPDVCPLHTDKKVPVCLCRADSFYHGHSCSSKPRFCSWSSLFRKFDFQNQASCHIAVNQALEKLRQDNLEFRASLDYTGKINKGQCEALFQKQSESDSQSQQALAYRARQEQATLHLHTVNKVWIIMSQKRRTNSSLSSQEGW